MTLSTTFHPNVNSPIRMYTKWFDRYIIRSIEFPLNKNTVTPSPQSLNAYFLDLKIIKSKGSDLTSFSHSFAFQLLPLLFANELKILLIFRLLFVLLNFSVDLVSSMIIFDANIKKMVKRFEIK